MSLRSRVSSMTDMSQVNDSSATQNNPELSMRIASGYIVFASSVIQKVRLFLGNHRQFAMKKSWQWKVARVQVVMGAGIRVADTNADYHLPEKKDDEDF
ncbi:hypothetical protein D8674_039485 [Pyrus ussuriensis x Pyrus communis]|uniref:Uncharacterized protein n=1 Tax=Pyrus ussuriensis x Pyrus communis TaxID=2448454 RepID=A0A5N5FSU0_9ROSA|nr:hypothetical protein D8674_039485 [Pyrus ussuriensis x Pyrus communis]